jgi:ADP-ribose pyrophosphatase YjhB (NUDIX family)
MSFITGIFKRIYWKEWKPEIRGVGCLIESEGRVLLIRHRYGKKAVWTLPNGSKRRFEKAKRAVVREVWNLVGIDVRNAVRVNTILTNHDNPDEMVHCFIAHAPDMSMEVDRDLILEAKWFKIEDVPSKLSLLAKALLQRLKYKIVTQVCEEDPSKTICQL